MGDLATFSAIEQLPVEDVLPVLKRSHSISETLAVLGLLSVGSIVLVASCVT